MKAYPISQRNEHILRVRGRRAMRMKYIILTGTIGQQYGHEQGQA